MVLKEPLILASASPRRAELLTQVGVAFETIPSNAPEHSHRHLTPSELARLNARNKACAIARRFPRRWVLGADTLVCLDTRVFGKPRHRKEARSFLGQLQGKSHQVVTGVCLLRCQPRRERLFVVTTNVRFRPLTPEQIDRYLDHVDPLDKAGAYAIQEHGEWIVEEIAGSYSNVVGLPVERLQEELAALTRPPATLANRAAPR